MAEWPADHAQRKPAALEHIRQDYRDDYLFWCFVQWVAEKRSWMAFADRMQQLPEAQRQRARRRILEWANMSPEERRIARLNHQNARRRPMPERVKEWERRRAFW